MLDKHSNECYNMNGIQKNAKAPIAATQKAPEKQK